LSRNFKEKVSDLFLRRVGDYLGKKWAIELKLDLTGRAFALNKDM